jgi:hypothetical protein
MEAAHTRQVDGSYEISLEEEAEGGGKNYMYLGIHEKSPNRNWNNIKKMDSNQFPFDSSCWIAE